MAKPSHDSPCHTRIITPSPALLSALALLAASHSAAALPAHCPPDFLCPFIRRNLGSAHATTTSLHPPQCTSVADKFVQGSDSLWRKTDSWTLFGSTCASGSSASPSSTTQPLPTSSQVVPSSNELDASVLPAGWSSSPSSSTSTEPSIILALAIILAGSICVFMICCVIWRRRKKKARDIERKLAHRPSSHADSQADGREKDARGKMRMWAKATARWKTSIRQSARRRKKIPVSSPAHRPLSPTLDDSPPSSAPSAPSRRASIAPEETDPCTLDAALSPNGNVSDPLPCLPDPSRSPSPPTYGASLDPRYFHPPSSAIPKQSLNPSSVDLNSLRRPSTDDEPLPYTPPRDGHVATDDKTQLAYIQALASSPSADDATGTSAVSAPEWHEVEDDLDLDLGIDSSKIPTSHSLGSPPPFPPPPSQGDIPLSFVYLDDHPLRYEDDDDMSSGPSLGGLPSAPPIDDPGLEPSAPSLESEDELFQDWEQPSFNVPEDPASADLASTSARATASSISPIPSTIFAAPRASLSSIQAAASKDGILPRYRP